MKKYLIYDEESKDYWRNISENKLYRLFTTAQGTFDDAKAFDEYEGNFEAWRYDMIRCGLLRTVNA